MEGQVDGLTDGRTDARSAGRFLRDGVDSGQTFRAAGVDSVTSCASAAEGHESSSHPGDCVVGVGKSSTGLCWNGYQTITGGFAGSRAILHPAPVHFSILTSGTTALTTLPVTFFTRDRRERLRRGFISSGLRRRLSSC